MNCDKMNDLMSAWLDGELTEAEEREMQEHLDRCPECQAVFEQLKGLHTSFSDLEELEPSANFNQRVMDQIREESRPKVVPFPARKKNRAWGSIAALAACAALVIGVGGMNGLMGGGAAAPESAEAPSAAPESAMMAPDMAKAMDEPAAYDWTPAEGDGAAVNTGGTMEYALSGDTPGAADVQAKQESENFEPEMPAPDPGERADIPTAREDLESQGLHTDVAGITQVICVPQLPEGLEEAVGLLVWEEREDGVLCAHLTEEQAGQVLQLALDQGVAVEHSVADADRAGDTLLLWLPE